LCAAIWSGFSWYLVRTKQEDHLGSWNRGAEMAAHKKFTVASDVAVYFCDPRSPWQRATSENTNTLLRQYLPRKSELSVYGQQDLDLIALKLNIRPRKSLR
jgi:IS30 family transposase